MIRLGQVVRVNQTRRTVDLVMLDNNEPVREARVLGAASSVSGSWNVPDMPKPASEMQAGELPAAGRSMVAAVTMCGRRPLVVGFVPAEGNEVVFTEADLEVHRHPSGVVTSIDQGGNVQVTHPGGATLRIGTPAVQDISTLAADQNWAIPAGTPPTITLTTGQVSLTIAAGSGNVVLKTSGDATVMAENATVAATQTATIMGASVVLGVGGKRVVVDGDPVSGGGTVMATQTRVTAG